MHTVSFARRAERLSAAMPTPAPARNISFDSGHALPSVLPDLTREAQLALTDFRNETLQYAPRPGLPGLRAWIAEYMAADGAKVSANDILVTNGAKHAIELVCRLLLDEGDSVVVTTPTYFTAIPIFRSYGAQFIEIGQDGAGLDVDELTIVLRDLSRNGKPLPKFIYNVPDFHNPTGVTMSLERRKALLDLAAAHQIFVVEDSPYRKVRFEGESIPSLKALDRNDMVFYMGTFSKLMAPGLRIGWAAGPQPMLARMAQLKTDGGSCPLTQRLILEFCAAGRLTAHTERVQQAYRSNRDQMLAAFRRELPEVSTNVPEGGYYLWLTLPQGIDGDAVARRAGECGVTVLGGSQFFARRDAGHPANHLRVAYSHATHDEIDEGVRRLATAFGIVASDRTAMAGSGL